MIDIKQSLKQLKQRSLYRQLRTVSGPQGAEIVLDGAPVLLLCSNNYLGLADDPRVKQAAAEAALEFGASSGASRLVSGNMSPHRELEQQLAAFKGYESALLFGSGYLANSGCVSALSGRGEVVFSDRLNHASIIDGCRLSQAEIFIYEHCDTEHLQWGLKQAGGRASLIVTDSVFSMDGDLAPLEEIVELARRYNTRVMVDEAHATGTVGLRGEGAVASLGLESEVDLVVGTLGKALGSYGAFACSSREISEYLVNRARSFIFSTALPPAVASAASTALQILVKNPELVAALQKNSIFIREQLQSYGLTVPEGKTPIVPLIVGDAAAAVRISEEALSDGIFAQAIRPPTVPEGSSRLRLTVMASHTQQQLDRAATLLAQAVSNSS